MRISTVLIVGFIFLIAAIIIAPPDFLSQITVLFAMLIVYGVLTLIISRFKSLKQKPECIKKLIVVIVCLLSITITYSVALFKYWHQQTAMDTNLETEQSETVVSENR